MHPILFQIPIPGFSQELPIRFFGVLVAAGFLLGMWIMGRLVQRYSADPQEDVQRYAAVHVWILMGILGGARLMYVLVEIAKGTSQGAQYVEEWWTVLFIWQGGLVMFGGFFGGMLLGAWKTRREGLCIAEGLDYGMPAAFFGLAMGRIGCLMVGDDYGKVVPEAYADLPFPITLRVPEVLHEGSLFGTQNIGQVLWATQPWMAINAALIGLTGVWLLRRRRYFGQVALVLALLYAITRFVIEYFRGDALRGVWFDGALSTSQLVAIGVAAAALVLLVLGRRKRTAAQP